MPHQSGRPTYKPQPGHPGKVGRGAMPMKQMPRPGRPGPGGHPLAPMPMPVKPAGAGKRVMPMRGAPVVGPAKPKPGRGTRRY